ncbi:MAG: hypothetical protein KJ732_06015 [Candidatus Margulisbacteria bacterium]|nr:hypothetical protein [Candidatus Margulisiibacteriota bacterium]
MLAIFVFSKGKEKAVNRTLALFSLTLAVWTLAQSIGEMAEAKAVVLIWTRINVGAAVLLPVLYLHFILSLLELKDGKKKILQIAYGLDLIFLVLVFTPWFVKDVAPVAGFKYYPQAGIVYPFFAIYLFSCFLYSLVQLVLALRQAGGENYRRLLYVFVASVVGFFGGATTFFPVFNIAFPVISHFALPIYVAITVYAIVRHKLLDITILVREGLIYSCLTILFAGFYVLVVLIANYLVSYFVHLNPLVTMFMVVFVSVIIFQPVRNRVQRMVDRVFFMGEYRYQKTINDLSEENRKLFRGLLQADKVSALGTLAAGMAHEIKNPLASIRAMTQILPENLNDKEFLKDYNEMIPRQLERINRIVENLLKVGKTAKLERLEVDINSIIREAVELNASLCKKQEIEIALNLNPLPKIIADPEQLQLVFTNLILNAVQAMPDEGKLAISSSMSIERIVVQVADNGSGIPADKLDDIFDPFFSLKEKGTGLGLFTAYRIIQEHGGSIEVASQQGKGTKFTIWLPIKPKQ